MLVFTNSAGALKLAAWTTGQSHPAMVSLKPGSTLQLELEPKPLYLSAP